MFYDLSTLIGIIDLNSRFSALLPSFIKFVSLLTIRIDRLSSIILVIKINTLILNIVSLKSRIIRWFRVSQIISINDRFLKLLTFELVLDHLWPIHRVLHLLNILILSGHLWKVIHLLLICNLLLRHRITNHQILSRILLLKHLCVIFITLELRFA